MQSSASIISNRASPIAGKLSWKNRRADSSRSSGVVDPGDIMYLWFVAFPSKMRANLTRIPVKFSDAMLLACLSCWRDVCLLAYLAGKHYDTNNNKIRRSFVRSYSHFISVSFRSEGTLFPSFSLVFPHFRPNFGGNSILFICLFIRLTSNLCCPSARCPRHVNGRE